MGFITADMNINDSLERAGLIPDGKTDTKQNFFFLVLIIKMK